jgi:hypothetical protein
VTAGGSWFQHHHRIGSSNHSTSHRDYYYLYSSSSCSFLTTCCACCCTRSQVPKEVATPACQLGSRSHRSRANLPPNPTIGSGSGWLAPFLLACRDRPSSSFSSHRTQQTDVVLVVFCVFGLGLTIASHHIARRLGLHGNPRQYRLGDTLRPQ